MKIGALAISSGMVGAAILSCSLSPILAAETPPSLQASLRTADQVQLRLSATPGRNYRVDTSSDLKSWAFLTSSNAASGTFDLFDSIPAAVGARFYRAAESAQIVGRVARLGRGTVRSWVRLDDTGSPTGIGVTLTEGALTNLPLSDPDYVLALPPVGTNTPFKHIWVNWNAHGHPPAGRYNVPHFDLHFYLITSAERSQISLADGGTKMYRRPPAQYIPRDYVLWEGEGIPTMGAHWIDLNSPEYNGQPFTKTFLHGSYDGHLIFWEPMITLAYLKTKPTVSIELKQPERFEVSGLYPTHYGINYSTAFQEYDISLDGLTQR